MSSRKTASAGCTPICVAGVLVDARVGLAQAHDARLDEGVEVRAQGAGALLAALVLPVVGEHRRLEAAGADALHGLEHGGAGQGARGHALHHRPGGEPLARRRTVALEGDEELLERELAPLEPRPGALRSGVHHHPVDEAGRDALLALEGRDGVKRRAEHHTPQVEDDRREPHGSLPQLR